MSIQNGEKTRNSAKMMVPEQIDNRSGSVYNREKGKGKGGFSMTREEKARVLLATAKAFVARGPALQYDQLSMDRDV